MKKKKEFVSNFFLQEKREKTYESERCTICEKIKNTIRMKIKIILINI